MASVRGRKLTSEAQTASAVGAAVELMEDEHDLVFELIASAVHASTTFDCDVEHSGDNTNWYTLASFSQLVGVNGTELVYPLRNTDQTAATLKYIRTNTTLAGATQEATVNVTCYYDKRD